jgi:hypothetical protein
MSKVVIFALVAVGAATVLFSFLAEAMRRAPTPERARGRFGRRIDLAHSRGVQQSAGFTRFGDQSL